MSTSKKSSKKQSKVTSTASSTKAGAHPKNPAEQATTEDAAASTSITTTASPATKEAPATTDPASATSAASPAKTPTALTLLATAVVNELDTMETKLGLDIVIAPNDKSQMQALKRVSANALGLAANIIAVDPTRFPDFGGIAEAADYAASMGMVEARVATLATHVQKSIQNQRFPATQQVLALYQVVKGLGRVTDNETMRELIPQLATALAPPRKVKKPKQTKEELAVKRAAKSRAKRIAKAQAVLAANTDPAASAQASVAVNGVTNGAAAPAGH